MQALEWGLRIIVAAFVLDFIAFTVVQIRDHNNFKKRMRAVYEEKTNTLPYTLLTRNKEV